MPSGSLLHPRRACEPGTHITILVVIGTNIDTVSIIVILIVFITIIITSRIRVIVISVTTSVITSSILIANICPFGASNS